MLSWLLACALIGAPDAALHAPPGWPNAAPAVAQTAPPLAAAPRTLPRKGALPRTSPRGNASRALGGVRSQRDVLVTTGGSLAIVVGLILVAAWALRGRGNPRGIQLPTEAVETLGRFSLAARQNVHLVRCGSKLLLVAVSPTSVETLTEITDPREVNHLLSICQRSSAHGATAAFRDVLERLGRERAPLA